MNSPGPVEELGADGQEAWTRCIASRIAEAVEQFDIDPPNRFVLSTADNRTPASTTVEWSALPPRPLTCLTRHRALRFLDAVVAGRVRELQEEYVEWRAVADESGIRRVEFTSELSDYWRVLAAYEPTRTRELIASFARVPDVDLGAVYRDCDPFSPSTTPEEREASFNAAMLSVDDMSPYNDGRAAITCMAQPTNTLLALLALVLIATNPRVVKDALSGRLRCLYCDESIPLCQNAAQIGRASDPLLVERLARLAYEGRFVGLQDPIGVYFQSAQSTRLRTRNGEPVSPDWFRFSRRLATNQPSDGRSRYQRVVFEPPAASSLSVSDLIDVATEEPIRYGGQIADLLQVGIALRVSDAGAVPVGELQPTELGPATSDIAARCADIQDFVSNPLVRSLVEEESA